jgi:opacity protein-like surface antigen
MKKLFVIGILLGLSNISLAQKMKKGNIDIGVGGGYSFATVASSEGANKSSRTSNNFYASAEYFFSNRWGIKAKLIKDNKGWDDGFLNITDQFGNTQSYTTNYELNYVTIPVMANWHFGGMARKWYLHFGLYMGFLTDAKETKLNNNMTDSFNGTDFGLAYGIGYKFPVSDDIKINIEYDEQDGFSDIFKKSSTSAVKNSRGSFNIGVIYSIK